MKKWVIILTKDCGFTINTNFILFKWRLKRKHSPARRVLRSTEVRRMEIRLEICISAKDNIAYLTYTQSWKNFHRPKLTLCVFP